jgi:hypothetical protein
MIIELADGEARHMGDGAYVLLQADEHGVMQSVYVDADDVARLAAAFAVSPLGAVGAA